MNCKSKILFVETDKKVGVIKIKIPTFIILSNEKFAANT